MRPSKHPIDTADSNYNWHWDKRMNAIVEVLDALGIRHRSPEVRDRVERLVEDTNRSYLALLSCTDRETGKLDAPE